MYISRLEWDEYRIDPIALHGVEPDEVWEVCADPFLLGRRQGANRYRMYGQSEDGRYPFVVLEQVQDTVYKPIIAWDMTDRERQNFRRLHK